MSRLICSLIILFTDNETAPLFKSCVCRQILKNEKVGKPEKASIPDHNEKETLKHK